MKTLRALLALWLVLAFALPVRARAAGGAESLDFLLMDTHARAVGLGGAYTALAADANALHYNPAGLGGLKQSEATFMHNKYVQGLSQEHLAFASAQGWSVNVDYLSFGSIERTTFADKSGTGAKFGINDLSVGAGYGRTLFDNFSVGGGVKILREQVDNVTASGFALDGGVLYGVPQVKGLSLGLALQNIGPEMKFQKTKEKLPLNARAGAAYAFPALGAMHTVALDVSKARTDKMRLGFGAESILGKAIAVRVGYTTVNEAGMGMTAGVGWIVNNAASIDYAIVPFDDLGIAHRISLSYRWGEPDHGTESRR